MKTIDENSLKLKSAFWPIATRSYLVTFLLLHAVSKTPFFKLDNCKNGYGASTSENKLIRKINSAASKALAQMRRVIFVEAVRAQFAASERGKRIFKRACKIMAGRNNFSLCFALLAKIQSDEHKSSFDQPTLRPVFSGSVQADCRINGLLF